MASVYLWYVAVVHLVWGSRSMHVVKWDTAVSYLQPIDIVNRMNTVAHMSGTLSDKET
jgi:hypothetical protein